MSEDTMAAETAAEEAQPESPLPESPQPESPQPESPLPKSPLPESPLAAKLLIVDDDKNMSALISRFLRGFKYEVVVEHDPRQALERLRDGDFSLTLVDIVMPHMGGIELVIRIKHEFPSLPVLVMTSFASVQTARRAVQAGADDFVTKTSEGEFWDLRIRKILGSR